MVSKRLFAALVVPVLLIPLAAYGYAHWTDTVFKRYKFHFRFPGHIGTYKVLYAFNETGTMLYHSKPEWMTILLSAEHIFKTEQADWYAWVGLMIHNTGDVPILVTGPFFTPKNDPDGIWPAFQEDTYYYGIFTGGAFTDVYAHVKLPPLEPNDIAPPPPGYWTPRPPVPHTIYLDPCHKIVIWTKLTFPGVDCSPIDFTLSFTVTFPP